MDKTALKEAQCATVGVPDALEGKLPVIPLTNDAERVTQDDVATGALLQHVLDDIAYAEGQKDGFCGFQHQAMVNEEGKLLYVLLTAYENSDGVQVARI